MKNSLKAFKLFLLGYTIVYLFASLLSIVSQPYYIKSANLQNKCIFCICCSDMLSEDSGKILNLEFLFTAWAFLSACSNDLVWNPWLGLSLINNATALQSSHLTNQLKPITGPVFIHRQLCVYLALSAQAGRDWSRCGLCRWDREETCEKKALCGRERMSSKIPWMSISSTPHNPLACFGGVWFGRALAGSRDLHTPSSRSCDGVQASLCCSPNHPQECRLSWGEHVCNSWQCQKARGITTARWSKVNSKPPLSPSLSLTYASYTHMLGFGYCSMHTVHSMHIFCLHRISELIAFTFMHLADTFIQTSSHCIIIFV